MAEMMGYVGEAQATQGLREAFSQHGGEYVRFAQAALLLGLGLRICPPSKESRQDFEEDEELEWPRVYELDHFNMPSLENEIVQELESHRMESNQDELEKKWTNFLIGELYRDDQVQATKAALGLIRLNMASDDPLICAAACLSWIDITKQLGDAWAYLSNIAINSQDVLARTIALRGLYRHVEPLPLRPSMTHLIQAPPSSIEIKAQQAVIVHGTIFEPTGEPISEWWKPGSGDFHQYLKTGPRPNVYSGNDYFRWSGGWNDYAREEATEKLINWLDQHGIEKPDVFAHSHGCNVSMMATKQRRITKLVLMSCPVHWQLYQPDFNNVDGVISIRIKWDMVIMADRGAQRFRDSRIREEVLPIWFKDHEDSRLSATWNARKLDLLLK